MEGEVVISAGSTEHVGPSSENGSQPHVQFDRGGSVTTSNNLVLDRVGEVVLTLDSDGLSWQSVRDMEKVSLFRFVPSLFGFAPNFIF